VAHKNQRAATPQYLLNSRQRFDDPVIAGYVTVIVQRHIKIAPHQDFLTFNINISNSFLGHNELSP
jgi:hypothetical protein